MERNHSLLRRQIRKHFGPDEPIPEKWLKFLDTVNDAYHQSDLDRGMLERSLDLSSRELFEANAEMKAVLQAFPDLF